MYTSSMSVRLYSIGTYLPRYGQTAIRVRIRVQVGVCEVIQPYIRYTDGPTAGVPARQDTLRGVNLCEVRHLRLREQATLTRAEHSSANKAKSAVRVHVSVTAQLTTRPRAMQPPAPPGLELGRPFKRGGTDRSVQGTNDDAQLSKL